MLSSQTPLLLEVERALHAVRRAVLAERRTIDRGEVFNDVDVEIVDALLDPVGEFAVDA